jgi:hypothetical protein
MLPFSLSAECSELLVGANLKTAPWGEGGRQIMSSHQKQKKATEHRTFFLKNNITCHNCTMLVNRFDAFIHGSKTIQATSICFIPFLL